MGACRVMHEKKNKKWIPTRKTFKISKKTSPKTPDTVKRPYKHNDTDLWDRGSMIRHDIACRLLSQYPRHYLLWLVFYRTSSCTMLCYRCYVYVLRVRSSRKTNKLAAKCVYEYAAV